MDHVLSLWKSENLEVNGLNLLQFFILYSFAITGHLTPRINIRKKERKKKKEKMKKKNEKKRKKNERFKNKLEPFVHL